MGPTMGQQTTASVLLMALAAPTSAAVEWSLGWVKTGPGNIRSDQITLDANPAGSRVRYITSGDSWLVDAGYHVNTHISVAVKYSNDLPRGVEEQGLGIGNIGRFDLGAMSLTGRYHLFTDQA